VVELHCKVVTVGYNPTGLRGGAELRGAAAASSAAATGPALCEPPVCRVTVFL
jgi:hypothetical protein